MVRTYKFSLTDVVISLKRMAVAGGIMDYNNLEVVFFNYFFDYFLIIFNYFLTIL